VFALLDPLAMLAQYSSRIHTTVFGELHQLAQDRAFFFFAAALISTLAVFGTIACRCCIVSLILTSTWLLPVVVSLDYFEYFFS
jgi:hypothetical protein